MKRRRIKGRKIGDLQQISIRLEPEQLYILNKVSEMEDKSISEVIRRIIRVSFYNGYLADRLDVQVRAAGTPKKKK